MTNKNDNKTIYTRSAKDTNDKNKSLEDQKKDALEFAKKHDFEAKNN